MNIHLFSTKKILNLQEKHHAHKRGGHWIGSRTRSRNDVETNLGISPSSPNVHGNPSLRDYEAHHWFPSIRPAIRALFPGGKRGIGSRVPLDSHEMFKAKQYNAFLYLLSDLPRMHMQSLPSTTRWRLDDLTEKIPTLTLASWEKLANQVVHRMLFLLVCWWNSSRSQSGKYCLSYNSSCFFHYLGPPKKKYISFFFQLPNLCFFFFFFILLNVPQGFFQNSGSV